MNFGNGTSETFTLNDRFQMINQTLSKGSEVLQKYDYGYGTVNLATGSVDTATNNGQLAKVDSTIGTSQQWSQRFGYDEIGRLKESREYKQGDNSQLTYKQRFDFDRFGNLYRKAANNGTAGQQNPLPYTPIEDSDISKSTNRFTTNTTYDDAGNVVTDNKFRTMGFGYDANGRMVKATKTSVPDALSVYDAAGMRVAEKVNDVWRFLIYDIAGKLIAEYGGLQATDEGGVKYVLSDWQGSTRAVLSNSGFLNARIDYTTFGEEIASGTGLRTAAQGFGNVNNPRQKYALTDRDDATGLDHTWFRKYENQAGRWTSPDPFVGSINLANPQTLNRYTYVENQPTNFIDPSGLLTILVQCHSYCTGGPDVTPGCETHCTIIAIFGDSGGPILIPPSIEPGGITGGSEPPTEPLNPCPVAPVQYPADAIGQQFEAARGKIVDTANLSSGTQNALNCLQNAIQNAGGNANPTSGWRPASYQAHFVDLWNKKKELQKYGTECQKLKNEVNNELKAIHQITGAPNPVNKSNHVKGTAFDIAISGVSGRQINAFANKCGLRRSRGDGEGHHFDFIGGRPREGVGRGRP